MRQVCGKKIFTVVVATNIISFIFGYFISAFCRYVQTSDFAILLDNTFENADKIDFNDLSDLNTPDEGSKTWISPKGNYYNGCWENGNLSKGTIITENSVYEGHIYNLMPHGYGVMYYNNGNIYKGNWRYGNKDGIGLKHNKDGSMFFGHWRAGLYNEPKDIKYNVEDFVYGIDLSFYQKYEKNCCLNWDNLALFSDSEGELFAHNSDLKTYMHPVSFAFIKATQGIRKDSLYNKHIINARNHDILVGSYHFFTIGDDVDEQIDNFISNVEWKKGDLPPILDIECEYYIKGDENPYIRSLRKHGISKMKKDAVHWLVEIERHFNVKPIIYTSERWKNEFLNDPIFNDYTFWIARYYNVKPIEGINWKFWQRTDDHFPNGYDTNSRNGIDANVFRGTYKDFVKYRNSLYN